MEPRKQKSPFAGETYPADGLFCVGFPIFPTSAESVATGSVGTHGPENLENRLKRQHPLQREQYSEVPWQTANRPPATARSSKMRLPNLGRSVMLRQV